MSVVQFHILHTFVNVRVILQHHYVTWRESLVEHIRHADSLLCGELPGIHYHAQHIFLIEVRVPDQLVYRGPIRRGVEFNELHLAIHDGLLCERAWR